MSASSRPPPFVPLARTHSSTDYSSIGIYSTCLFTASNEANHTLVHCPRHVSILPTSYSSCRTFPWCVVLFCESCNFYWSVCSQCSNVRTRMTNRKQCNRHNAKYHGTTGANGRRDIVCIPATTNSPENGNTQNLNASNQPAPSPQGVPVNAIRIPAFSREASQVYFVHNQTDRLGPASLISLSHFRHRHSSHQIPPQEVYNQMLIAQHASYLTKGQKKNFANLLQNLLQTCPHVSSGSANVPRIPTSF